MNILAGVTLVVREPKSLRLSQDSLDPPVGEWRRRSQLIDIKLALADLLRAARTRRRLTRCELAERIGSGQSRVAKLEAGDRSVSVDLLARSAIAAGAKRSDVAEAVAGRRK